MLEGLGRIEWSKLSHAYGMAEDVPDLLRQLLSTEVEEREAAMNAFHGNIWHQGTVYEASAYAVPFLIELLEAPAIAGKDRILILLELLGNGSSYCAVHEQISSLKKQAGTPEWQEQKRKEIGWVKAAQTAVMAGKAVYLGLIADPEPKVREAAAYLLACLERPNPELANTLWEKFEREPDERVRATLLLAFGYLAEPNAMNQSLLLNGFVAANTQTNRLAAALSLSRISPDSLPTDVLQSLLEAAANPDDCAELGASPWAIYGEERMVQDSLTQLSGKAADYARRWLEKTHATAVHPQALALGKVMLDMAFPDGAPPNATLKSLTPADESSVYLREINMCGWIQSAGGQAKDFKNALLFRAYGLDDKVKRLLVAAVEETDALRKQVRELLGGTPPTRVTWSSKQVGATRSLAQEIKKLFWGR